MQKKIGMKFIRALSKRWKWFYVAAWLLFGLSIAGYGAIGSKPPENEAAFNLPFFMFDAAGWAIVLSFISLALSSLLFSLHSRSLLSTIGVFSLPALVAIVVLALIGPAILPTLWRLKIVHANDHAYQLVVHYPSIELSDGGLYLLYECDSLAITCRELYQHPAPSRNYEWYRSISDRSPLYQLEQEQDDVVLYIREQPVFTYDASQ